MKVQTDVTIYELNGKDCPVLDGPRLSVFSNWFGRVALQVGSGDLVVILAADLQMAIQNAINIRH